MTVKTAQHTTKEFLDTFRDPVYKDNGVTEASTHVQFQDPPYSITLIFGGDKNIDVVYSIGQPTSSPIPDHDGGTIGYNEQVPIRIQTVDKPGITGIKMLERCQAVLRQCIEEHWNQGTYRSLKVASKPGQMRVGAMIIYGIDYVLAYERGVT